MPKPRKKYRPKHIIADPMSWATAGVFTFPIQTQQDIMKIVYTAFIQLRNGVAKREDWNTVCQAINIGEALCMLHIGDNLIDKFNEGHQALHQVALRMLDGKSSTCYASELAAISEAIEMHSS